MKEITVCISIDKRPSDVISVKVTREQPIIEQVNPIVQAFIEAEVCNIHSIEKLHSKEFKVISTEGTEFNIEWRKVTFWTDDEVKNL